jgi:hypothetical protein
MHDGAFTTLAEAIRHHLDASASLLAYNPASQDLPPDLAGPIGPTVPLIAALDPRLRTPIELTPAEFDDLLAFVRDALLDHRADPDKLRRFVPGHLPSGNPTLTFQFNP